MATSGQFFRCSNFKNPICEVSDGILGGMTPCTILLSNKICTVQYFFGFAESNTVPQ